MEIKRRHSNLVAYLSDGIYETIRDEYHFKKGHYVRLISDNPDTLGYHPKSEWVTVCPCGNYWAAYHGILKTDIRKL